VKLITAQLFRIFPAAAYGSRRFITVYRTARNWTHPNSVPTLNYILMSFCHASERSYSLLLKLGYSQWRISVNILRNRQILHHRYQLCTIRLHCPFISLAVAFDVSTFSSVVQDIFAPVIWIPEPTLVLSLSSFYVSLVASYFDTCQFYW
jgi:hypothetical protein